MEHDQKEFLALLQEHKSEDTKKARRNLSTVSFVVISIWLLRINLKDVKVLGVDISHSAEVPVLLIVATLLVYWLIMFLVSWRHDKEIQAERQRFLDVQVKRFNERYEYGEKKRKETGGRVVPGDFDEAKATLEVYQAQQTRLQKAAMYGNIMRRLEIFVPLGLAAIALIVLIFKLICPAL